LVLAVPEANSDHAAAAMTKLPVGVAVFITFLIGLVMMASIGIIGGSAASPTAQQEIPPNYWPSIDRRPTPAPGRTGRCWPPSARSRRITASCRHRG
jgi:hypothetical protein